MSISRKELIERLKAKISEFDSYLNEPPTYEDKIMVREYRHEAYRKWDALSLVLLDVVAALPVAPAPVAAPEMSASEYVDAAWGPLRVAADLCERSDYKSCAFSLRSIASDIAEGRLIQAPPVQEGPKGVEADAKFDELLKVFASVIYTQGFHQAHSRYETFDYAKWAPAETESLRQYFKQCTAQSIPAAPCQCKPDETTGWTEDDIMVPRCNVCGLVVMKVIAERKAVRAPASIDEEGREALKEAVANFREDMSDLHPQSSLLPIYRKHVAAIERLLSGN